MLGFLKYSQYFETDFMGIFVIDAHPLLREAVATLIHRLSPTAAVAELDRLAAVPMATQLHGVPELICLEPLLPDSHGVSGVRELRQQFPDAAIVVLTAAALPEYEDLSMEAGANAFIQKSASTHDIASVLRGFLSNASGPEEEPKPEKLSKRQKQLLVLIDKGMSNRDIAQSLQISEHTVKVHLWRLFRRLQVKSRSQASHLARTRGLL